MEALTSDPSELMVFRQKFEKGGRVRLRVKLMKCSRKIWDGGSSLSPDVQERCLRGRDHLFSS